ncbi:MAG: hypothetical protein KAS76_02195 [Thermoplasmatales archaeon]|nr:hypothetical protein [Thermoplasmatales archaeon]
MAPAQEIALHRIRKIMENSKPAKKKKDGKKILINSVDGRHMPKAYIEGGIAKALQLRGHDVKTLLCIQGLNMCTTHFTVNKPFDQWVCDNCTYFSKQFYETIEVPYGCYNNVHSKKELKKIESKVKKMSTEQCNKYIYKGVNVGFHAMASAERYYMGGDPPKKEYDSILRKELINAIISTDLAEKIVKEEKPDILVTTHACYSSWGSFADYLRNNNVEIRVWGAGYKLGTLIFDFIKFPEYFKQYFKDVRKKKLLTKKEKKELEQFFGKRMRREEGEIAQYGFQEKTDIKKHFNFDKFDKTYAIFPNVPWDIAAMSTEGAFTEVYDWISSTIDIFKKQPKKQLIIKIHPSELTIMESKKTVNDFLKSNYHPLPENIKVIPPDTKINPYALFPHIDLGIVFTGTVGLEMPMNGIPAVVTGAAHYKNNGFTIDVNTKEEYRKVLTGKIPKLTKEQIEIAKVYAYFYFIKSFLKRDFVFQNNFLDMGWKVKSIEGFKPGNYKHLDVICNYIINNGTYHNW